MKYFSQLYQILCDGIDLVNSTFAFHVIIIFINAMYINIFMMFSLLKRIFQMNDPVIVHMYNISWILMQYFLQILIVSSGSSVTENARNTSRLITKILNELELKEETSNSLQNFVSRVNSKNLEIRNACFTIDWKLLVTVRKFNG